MTTSEDPAAVKTMHRMFRQHDTAPTGVESPLYRQLTQEWADLNSTTSVQRQIRRWSRTETVLAPFTRPGEIVDAIDEAPYAEKDALLLALIRLFQKGHQLAGRIVLQAFLPKLCRVAHSAAGCTGSPDTWAEDSRHIALGEFWGVMSTYPVERRPSKVGANLSLDTLNRVSDARSQRFEIPVAPYELQQAFRHVSGDLTWVDGQQEPGSRAEDQVTNDWDLLQLISWGVEEGAITRDEGQLLTMAYLPEKTAGYGFPDAASQFGISQAAARQRCSRAARRLTAAVRTEMNTTPSSDTELHVA